VILQAVHDHLLVFGPTTCHHTSGLHYRPRQPQKLRRSLMTLKSAARCSLTSPLPENISGVHGSHAHLLVELRTLSVGPPAARKQQVVQFIRSLNTLTKAIDDVHTTHTTLLDRRQAYTHMKSKPRRLIKATFRQPASTVEPSYNAVWPSLIPTQVKLLPRLMASSPSSALSSQKS
jgi:hypothetical protein